LVEESLTRRSLSAALSSAPEEVDAKAMKLGRRSSSEERTLESERLIRGATEGRSGEEGRGWEKEGKMGSL